MLTRKDLLDYIDTRQKFDELAANASAFAKGVIEDINTTVDKFIKHFYEYTKFLYIMYHENTTNLCLSVYYYSYYDTETLLRRYDVKGVMY